MPPGKVKTVRGNLIFVVFSTCIHFILVCFQHCGQKQFWYCCARREIWIIHVCISTLNRILMSHAFVPSCQVQLFSSHESRVIGYRQPKTKLARDLHKKSCLLWRTVCFKRGSEREFVYVLSFKGDCACATFQFRRYS